MKLENAKPGVEVINKYDGARLTVSYVNGEGQVVFKDADGTLLASLWPSSLRLANKPKRAELVARIAELEAEKTECADQTVELNKMSSLCLELQSQVDRLHQQRFDKNSHRMEELEKELETEQARWQDAISAAITESGFHSRPGGSDSSDPLDFTLDDINGALADAQDTIDELKDGTYFANRPHREKWQHVAQVTGLWVAGDKDGTCFFYPEAPVINDSGERWYSKHDNGQDFYLIPKGTWTDEPFESRIVGPTGEGKDETK